MPKDSSYVGELARLGGLACLGEISPSLRSSYENVNVSYENIFSYEISPRRASPPNRANSPPYE